MYGYRMVLQDSSVRAWFRSRSGRTDMELEISDLRFEV